MFQEFKYNYIYSMDNLEPVHWDEVPIRIRMSNGSTRTDKATFTKEELEDAGYTLVSVPVFEDFDEHIHEIIWNGTEYNIVELSSPPEDDGTAADVE